MDDSMWEMPLQIVDVPFDMIRFVTYREMEKGYIMLSGKVEDVEVNELRGALSLEPVCQVQVATKFDAEGQRGYAGFWRFKGDLDDAIMRPLETLRTMMLERYQMGSGYRTLVFHTKGQNTQFVSLIPLRNLKAGATCYDDVSVKLFTPEGAL